MYKSAVIQNSKRKYSQQKAWEPKTRPWDDVQRTGTKGHKRKQRDYLATVGIVARHRCVNCNKPKEDHAKGNKCLFEVTYFKGEKAYWSKPHKDWVYGYGKP
jgi:hypothetical protein